MNLKTLIVIPCYNEADRLNSQAFLDYVASTAYTGLLFVNDGSNDNTAQILNELAAKAPEHISVLHLSRNSGKAEAVRQGFLRGLILNPELIAYLDADLAAPLHCIREMEFVLSKDRKDIAIGARVALLGRHIERNTSRHLAGRVFATIASLVLGLKVYDTQCGAKLFRVNERLKAVFAAPFTVKWIFDVEILARFIISERNGQPRVADICLEYPLHEWSDKKGSKVRLKDFITSALDLVKIIFILQKKSLPGS